MTNNLHTLFLMSVVEVTNFRFNLNFPILYDRETDLQWSAVEEKGVVAFVGAIMRAARFSHGCFSHRIPTGVSAFYISTMYLGTTWTTCGVTSSPNYCRLHSSALTQHLMFHLQRNLETFKHLNVCLVASLF